jgi:GNAT superfamily N-acetyltransferase
MQHGPRGATFKKMVIRHAFPWDAEWLSALARRAKGSWGYPAEWLDAWADELTLTADYIDTHRVFIAEDDGQTVGVCALEDHDDRWELAHVWVEPARHGEGVGKMLVMEAVSVARSIRPDPITVTSDPNAAAFYEKLGARLTGSRPAPAPGSPERTLPIFEFSGHEDEAIHES